MTTTTTATQSTRQRRLRAIVKRLVIELGYLEHCLAERLQDVNIQTAAAGIDTAIDCLNEYLTSELAAPQSLFSVSIAPVSFHQDLKFPQQT